MSEQPLDYNEMIIICTLNAVAYTLINSITSKLGTHFNHKLEGRVF